MTRFHLRLQDCDFPLGEGEVLVGRDGGICHLVIDDPRVSRRHAALRVRAHGVTIVDLESSNGVLVNGVRISKPVALEDRDVLFIGGHELHVGIGRGRAASTDTSGAHKQEDPLAIAIENALDSGRTDEAARIAMDRLQATLADADAGLADARSLSVATAHALRMAAATRQAIWIDWVFQAHHVAGVVIPVAVIDQMFVIARVSRYTASRWMNAYVEGLDAHPAGLSSMDRIAHIRAQGLRRSLRSNASGPQETCPDPLNVRNEPHTIARSR